MTGWCPSRDDGVIDMRESSVHTQTNSSAVRAYMTLPDL